MADDGRAPPKDEAAVSDSASASASASSLSSSLSSQSQPHPHQHSDAHSRSGSRPHSRSLLHHHAHSHLHLDPSPDHSQGSALEESPTQSSSLLPSQNDVDITGQDDTQRPSEDSQESQDQAHSAESNNEPLELRQLGADAPSGKKGDSLATQVVQTVEIVQVVDRTGKPLSIHTVYAPAATVVVDRVLGLTVAISAPGSSRTAPASVPAASYDDPGNGSSLTYHPPVTYATTTHTPEPTSSEEKPEESEEPSKEPTQKPQRPQRPSHSPDGGAKNSTSSKALTNLKPLYPSLTRNVAATPSNTPTVISDSLSGSRTIMNDEGSSSSQTASSSQSTEVLESSLTYETFESESTYSSSIFSSSTATIGDSGDETDSGPEATDLPDATADDDNGGGAGRLSSQEKQIVGGVVGAVAGAAFLLLLVMLAVKWRKRRSQIQQLAGEGGAGPRSLGAGPGTADNGGGGSGSGAAMAEHSTPFAVPAALASLTGGRKQQDRSSQGGRVGEERGFVRVSGRKLPSVLQHGGDGYSDPRASTMSGESDYYRGSQAFDVGASHRLALGTPMRPVSGVPVMRSGPARTAVAEENPFADPPSPPLTPPRDGLGRTLVSQDGSRGSGSRFQENI